MPALVLAFFILNNAMQREDCFKVGYISKTHGLKGEVTAILEYELDFENTSVIFLETNGNLVPHFPEEFSGTDEKAVVRFEGITTLDQASHLKGCSLYLPKTARVRSGRGEFYDDEIVGFMVTDENEGQLGTVTEVTTSKLSRLITLHYHRKEILIPVNSPFIKSVNKSKRTISVNLPEGYLDI
jgi:16S rRNA processing protein RimM